ncbi:MAG TPA: DUF4446 family protein [Clostridiales bacterium]|nr:DUF4446 family protein [Clostridiales bacterium]
MDFIELISSNAVYFILGIGAFVVLILVYNIILTVKLSKLNKKYKKFMTGATGENLESQVLSRFADIDNLKTEAASMNKELGKVKENLLTTYQKIGVVKYDAFKEMGGKLSFVLALLDKNNNGILLNSVHSSREGCYTYLKEIIKGESFLELSEDERNALDMARNSNNYME